MLALVRKLNQKLIEHNAVDENQKLIDCDAAGPRLRERAPTWTGSQNNMQRWRNPSGFMRNLFLFFVDFTNYEQRIQLFLYIILRLLWNFSIESLSEAFKKLLIIISFVLNYGSFQCALINLFLSAKL